jgi:hypothetical protein
MKDALQKMVADDVAEVMAGSAWSAVDIAAFEAESGMNLPHRLVAYLMEFGTVFYESPLMDVVFPSGSRFTTELGRIGEDPETVLRDTKSFLVHTSSVTGAVVAEARIPSGFVIMGNAEGNRSYLLMDAVNRDNPAVYLWGLAYDPWGQGDNTMGLGHMADDLAEWLAAMAANPYRQ